MPRSRILDCSRAVLYVYLYLFLSLERFNLLFIVVWNENVPKSRIHAEGLIGLCHLVTKSHGMAEPELRGAFWALIKGTIHIISQ